MSDRRFIAEHRRRVPEAVQPLQTAVAPQERLLALARGAGNAAIARMLGSAPGRTLMRTRSAAGDLGTADEVADLLEGREPAPRPRSFSAPPALLTVPPAAAPALGPVPAAPVDTAPLAPAPPLEEAHDEPSEPATVEAEPEAAATVEAPADVAVPTTAPEKKPRIPKSPQPLPTHPTISAEKQGTFDVQAHAQFVRDALKLAFQGNAENEKVLYTRYAEVVEIASGRSTDPATQQRTKIANAEAAYKPLHEALEKPSRTSSPMPRRPTSPPTGKSRGARQRRALSWPATSGRSSSPHSTGSRSSSRSRGSSRSWRPPRRREPPI